MKMSNSLSRTLLHGLVALVWVVVSDIALAQCAGTWQPVPGPLAGGGFLRASTLWDPDGTGPLPERLVVGGSFVKAGSVTAVNVAALNLDTGEWSTFGAGLPGFPYFSTVSCLVSMPNGDLIADGHFTPPGGSLTYGVVRWNQSNGQWTPMGSGFNDDVRALGVFNGELIAVGEFTAIGGAPINRIARWTGTTWQPIGTGMNGRVYALTTFNGELIAGGEFTTAGGAPANSIARWDGSTWWALAGGLNGQHRSVFALTTLNGNLIAGGSFFTAGTVTASGIASWNGTVWSTVGTPMFNNAVRSLAITPDGDLIAGGQFTFFGGIAANRIARSTHVT